MNGFELLRPGWLSALPLLTLFALLLARRGGGVGDWTRVAHPALMAAMRATGRVEPGRGAAWIAALGVAACVALALAGPSVPRRDAVAFRNLDGVVFVLDASPSMTEGENWTRMQVLARHAVAALGTRPAGLVVYAGDAYVATDMTTDTHQLGQTLSLIGAGTVPDPGSRPERGLALAARMLEEGDIVGGDVILVTDGGGLGPAALTQAAALAARGARVSVAVPGAAASDAAALAALGRGGVHGPGGVDALAAFLVEEGRARLRRQDWPLAFRADLGRWLFLAALAPAILMLRRGAT